MAVEPDGAWERSLRHLDVEDLSLLATALEEKAGRFTPGVGFDWQDERAEELWFVIVMMLEVEGNRPVWQQTHVYPHDDQRWWAVTRLPGEAPAVAKIPERGEWEAMVVEMRDATTEACTCGFPEKPCLRLVLRNGPPFPSRPCEPARASHSQSVPRP